MKAKKNKSHNVPKKSLGQNFLHDEQIIEDIIDVANITEGDVIIEVGPGEGVLTEKLLAAGAEVFAVEIDTDLIGHLENRFAHNKNCHILNEDIRRFNIPAFLKEKNIDRYKVVANLPYYITSSIIRIFLESEAQPKDMTIMVQKEVAERICAQAGSMSILAFAVQFYGTPEYMFTVPAHAFYPVPQVDSAILRIDDIQKSFAQQHEKDIFRLVRAGFSARRKKLAKNLVNSLHIDKELILDLMQESGLGADVRAQELSVESWIQLTEGFQKNTSHAKIHP